MRNQTLKCALLAISFTSVMCSAEVEQDFLRDLNSSNQVYLEQKKELKDWYSSLKRNAQKLGYNHGFSNMMKKQKEQLLKNEARWDELLTFDDVTSLMQDGVAEGRYLIGGIVDRVDESVSEVDDNTIFASDSAFVFVKYPRVSISKPHWKDYLFLEQPIALQLPPESALPRNEKERRYWKKNIDIGWARGEQASVSEMRSRISRLFADLRGMIRYWTLIENGMLNNASLEIVKEAVNYEVYDGGEKLIVNPTLVSIDSQAKFNPSINDWHLITTTPNENNRAYVKDAVIDGDLLIDDIDKSQIYLQTEKFERQREEIPNDNLYK